MKQYNINGVMQYISKSKKRIQQENKSHDKNRIECKNWSYCN